MVEAARSPENRAALAAWRRSPENRANLAAYSRSPENRRRAREHARRIAAKFHSVPRAGADHEPLEPLDTEHCPYCDRDIPWASWEDHVTREQRKRGIPA
jgi:ribulose-5-phosphate 4-epimerase/fuculose-1-phosphate aldolase